MTKYLGISIISILTGFLSNRLFFLLCKDYQLNPNPISNLNFALENLLSDISSRPFFISLDQIPLIVSAIVILLCIAIYSSNQLNKKTHMKGIEHGSASWATNEDIKPFTEKSKDNHMILTATEGISINTRKTLRNNNILVVGGSGSGKTRFFLKPNLMQLHSSFVITDPKGTVLLECGKMMEQAGYDIKVFNTINFSKSMHYNPFAYIREEKDILKFVNTLILNTNGDEKGKEDFWVKAERLLYQALIGYIFYECPEEEHNFATLIDLIDEMEVREDDEEFKCAVDILFEDLEVKEPNHFAVRQYKKYKLAAGKTAKSILISVGARLAPFDINVLREITSYDEMDLHTIGEKKTAMFIIIDDTDTTFNFLVAIMYTQMFNLLCNLADDKYKGRLPVHVRCLLDEFANIGQIPNFEKLIATIRSREISACVILQNMAQLKGIYKEQAGTIVGNCDTFLFLGSGEEETQKSISSKVGKATIDFVTINQSKGNSGSTTVNHNKTGRDLITPEEVGLLKTDECLLFIRGVKPFKSKKFKLESHKRYKELADYDEKNYYSFEDIKKSQSNIEWINKTKNVLEIE
ncbi:TraM recognition domain-containing protein [Turicibacter sanguinis]|uniref:VirD4-like conjugal transfer protein, CD1115 family n=1 Tax=Erysipelotrichales TaxID=526525 RepID=UPI0012B6D48A|nr:MULTISPECIES: type IV secretory system conjugative DNA transfer family protein [unclassified Turicibacter]MTH07932.1 TraM recognition domain-containing protein [Turicibacter sanguinis]MCU7194814.1 type IV secretory system conjugative DNA transfer family protein [Turicibacter sp. T129]MCU7206335.1 type IV secretory system conjugative DNA transfer family protein [Turicibacter sp. GALT-G1]MTH10889.1 TraM recognition domain-containing protein [Turicibacter sanguinis]MTH13670.1 TraM recognition 